MMYRQVWDALKKVSLFWVSGMSLIGACAMVQSQRHDEAKDALTLIQAQWQQRQQQVADQQRFAAEIAAYLSHREQWQSIGLMSPINVSAWEKSLAEIQEAFGLSHLSYEFLPATLCDPALCLPKTSLGQQANIKVTLSHLKLAWTVKHEAEVLQWLRHLALHYAGAMRVHQCVWTMRSFPEQMDATCELHLFNFPDVLPNPSAHP